jgi:hypothetical protein
MERGYSAGASRFSRWVDQLKSMHNASEPLKRNESIVIGQSPYICFARHGSRELVGRGWRTRGTRSSWNAPPNAQRAKVTGPFQMVRHGRLGCHRTLGEGRDDGRERTSGRQSTSWESYGWRTLLMTVSSVKRERGVAKVGVGCGARRRARGCDMEWGSTSTAMQRLERGNLGT